MEGELILRPLVHISKGTRGQCSEIRLPLNPPPNLPGAHLGHVVSGPSFHGLARLQAKQVCVLMYLSPLSQVETLFLGFWPGPCGQLAHTGISPQLGVELGAVVITLLNSYVSYL